jgi:uncharacterized protein YhbP (UPF0306 family)
MSVEALIREYLSTVKVMQLATSTDDQPWACTVHYYSDESLNFYWISTLEREHSRHIAQNPKVAATILVHENTPSENYVIGISVGGTAELIGEYIDEKVGQAYVQKHAKDPNLLADIASGKNPHKFYCLRPSRFVLFDSKSFPGQPRQEWRLEQG